MDIDTQLLCTFTTVDGIDDVIDQILDVFSPVFGKIYVLENVDDPNQLILTYNVTRSESRSVDPPPSTISVHRKKFSNTIYTINAINRLIESKNGGVLDKSFRIDWTELRNTILVTAHGSLKVVNTKLQRVVTV